MDEEKIPAQPFHAAVLLAADGADPSLVRLAEDRLQTDAVRELPGDSADVCVLRADAAGFALVKNGCVLRADFLKMLPRLISNNLNGELLVKASRFKTAPGPLTAIDATAGLGEDAFLLAAAGFDVQLYERDPVIALLLYDALRRGGGEPELAPVIARMTLHMADSTEMLPRQKLKPDIVLLDPMFPERQKSGSIKKKFQLLHLLEQPCRDEQALLDAALSCSPRRIVVKRPANGPYLAGKKPSYSIKGNSIRYDCIVCAPQNRE